MNNFLRDSEDTIYTFELPPEVLVDDENVIAVEIHQQENGGMDGMYDVWETNYFGSTEGALPDGDPDGDRFSNSE